MPNAINPNDYNIDNFNSQNLGPISVTDFRTYIFNHNLMGVNPEVQSMGYSLYPRGIFTSDLWLNNATIQDLPNLTEVAFIASNTNNQTSPRPFNIKQNLWTNEKPFYGSPINEEEFSVGTKSLEDPGSVDAWYEGNGFETEVSTIRDIINLSNNDYGPEFISEYNDFNNPIEATGYKQYPTNNGTADVLGQVVGRTLGFSTTNFINFPSDLQSVAQERRKEELKNRIKLNFIDDTIGKINLDPLGLLAGQKLFTPNYTITRPEGFLGKVFEFSANLTGFNVPVSIIPGGKNVKIGSNAFQDDLIDHTGKGQRDLLYANVYSSKYSPELLTKGFDPNDEDKSKLLGKIGDFFDDLGKKKADNYLKIGKKTEDGKKTLAQKVGGFVNGLISPQGDESLIPTPEQSVNPLNPLVSMGIDGKYNALQSLDNNSKFNFITIDSPPYSIAGATTDYQPNNTTMVPTLADSDNPNSSFRHQTPSTNELFDWRSRDQKIANRGLMKFTQDMVNNAEVNGHRGGAQYIGRFNSDSNIVQGQKDIGGGNVKNTPKHKDVSMGNIIRSEDDTYYCRSWSTRNPYQNHYDLIRNNTLHRNKFINGLSVLEDNGHVKIAPQTINGSYNRDGEEIKRHMFSLENLAWKDAPESVGLRDCEKGPNGGRLMWFPPYDLSFTDNTSVSWEQNIFIGRAEPIYTYNHTDRKGTLSFSVIVDHPSVINEMKSEEEAMLYKFFSGCGIDVEKFFGKEITVAIDEEEALIKEVIEDKKGEVIKKDDPLPESTGPKEAPEGPFECYFRNARNSELVGGYRTGKGRNITKELAIGVEYELNDTWKTNKDEVLLLNKPFNDKIEELIDFLATNEGQNYRAEFIGYTSAASPSKYNKLLSIDRAQSVFEYVTQKVKFIGENGNLQTVTANTCTQYEQIYITGKTESISLSGTGVGYVNTNGYDIGTTNITGTGSGIRVNITTLPVPPAIDNIQTVEFVVAGEGYAVGDILAIDQPGAAGGTIVIDSVSTGSYNGPTCLVWETGTTQVSIGTGYTYLDRNFESQAVGFVCTDTPQKCASATEDGELKIKDLKISEVDPDAALWKKRWIINAQGEQNAAQVDDDGNSIADEDAKFGNSDKDSKEAKEDRRVVIKVTENLEYIANNTLIKLEPRKLEQLETKPIDKTLDRGLAPLPLPTIVFDDNPVTDKFGTGPSFTIVEPQKDLELEKQALLFASMIGKSGEEGTTLGEKAIDEEVSSEETRVKKAVTLTVERLFNECTYFEKIKKDDPFVYKTINDKIKHFHPAFHSVTPEGFNNRLTFLQQCTRQGPNIRGSENNTQNMAFGRPPICVLRIGDFYYTKIVIDSININYEPLQWDLNPEGIGVQPQIAKVDLNFSFIGGSSISGPIRQLQNAVSFNYFANTSVANPRRYFTTGVDDEYKTLDELMVNLADGEKIKTGGEGSNFVGFGSFKSQIDADREITPPKMLSDSNDKQEQTNDVIERETVTAKLPLLTLTGNTFNTQPFSPEIQGLQDPIVPPTLADLPKIMTFKETQGFRDFGTSKSFTFGDIIDGPNVKQYDISSVKINVVTPNPLTEGSDLNSVTILTNKKGFKYGFYQDNILSDGPGTYTYTFTVTLGEAYDAPFLLGEIPKQIHTFSFYVPEDYLDF